MSAERTPLVVLAAGGTGGHMFPANALADELKASGCAVALLTDRRGSAYGGSLAESDIHRLPAGQVAGRGPVGALMSLATLALGTWRARRLLRRLRPAAAVGFGGYASVPAMLAAHWAGVPTIIHEQNAVLGRANRLLASRVDRIAVCFESALGLGPRLSAKLSVTGNPVRPAIAALARAPYPRLAAKGTLKILVLGGSQGASIFSRVVPAAAALLPAPSRRRLAIAQQCRSEDLDRTRRAYVEAGMKPDLASFFDDVPARLRETHLVICRAGASTVAEIAASGRPAILVPYPHAIDDHQTENARALEQAGGGWLTADADFTAESLAKRLGEFLAAPARLAKAAQKARALGRPDAVKALAALVLSEIPGRSAA